MAPQEGQHLLYLVAVLRRATENVIVPASLVVHGLHRFTSRSQLRLEIARHLDVRDRDPVISPLRLLLATRLLCHSPT